VVVGIGVNVAMTADQLPVPTATSLAIALSPALPPTLDELLDALLVRLEERYAGWEAGTNPLEEYRGACSTLGRAVRVDLPAGPQLFGTARDVDAEGRLLVETSTGVQAVAAGDVVYVR
jgi:BirA family biotin operon repressor/biotin-[acetyl-CoA-carboxylase] ligase